MNKFLAVFPQFYQFILSSFDELRTKVTWPKYKELQSNSILIIVASFIFALVIGVIDYVFDFGMNWFYGIF
jgi:preprotein translocase subunit SecE